MYKLRFNAKQRSMDEFMYEYSTKFNSLDYESNHNVAFWQMVCFVWTCRRWWHLRIVVKL